MKRFNKYMTIALAGALAAGCNDLDTEPLGSIVTEEQKEAVLEKNPDMAEAAVNALPQGMKLAGSLYSSHHADFGVPSLFLITDSRGEDMPAPNSGFNWYAAASEMSDFAWNYYDNLIYWQTYYNLINSANNVAASISTDTDDAQLQYYLGQALVYRAYAYANLAPMYAFTYAYDPTAPCVPIITPENADDAAINGNPRATVAEVYNQVISDLTTAISLLESAEQGGVTRSDKRYANAMVAYGLRARAYLLTLNWSAADADAQKAIQLAGAEGLSPLNRSEASVPGFTDITEHNIMWGILTTSSELFTQGVRNFASMMGSWMSNGYCAAGVYRSINKKLYNSIPISDVRRNWWLNGTTVPSTLPSAYVSYIASCEGMDSEFLPYTQVKFGAADDTPGTTDGATDVPLMRIEEMYYISAEAQGMQSNGANTQTLTSFVKQYRNANYSYTESGLDAFIDEIYKQRRIEFWGEGFSYFDMMRFQKGIDRRGGGFDAAWVYVVAPNDPVLLYVIIQSEQQSNPAIGNCDNGASVPTAVPDEE